MTSLKPYIQRRAQLALKMGENTVAIVCSGAEKKRNGDCDYRFRPHSHFYYLTGFDEPHAVLLVMGGAKPYSVLFNQPHNAQEEIWTGKRLGQKAAIEQLQVDEAYDIHALSTHLPKLCSSKSIFYYDIGHESQIESLLLSTFAHLKAQTRSGQPRPEQLQDITPILGQMRLIKTPDEMECIQKACDISVLAHQRAMQTCRSKQFEYQLEAELLYTFTEQGCRGVAYEPIVAGGENACTLHYTKNNAPLISGQLVLIDAAGEYQNYASDITRTFPVNGQFSPQQRELYTLVLHAQRSAIALLKPGLAWGELQTCIIHILTQGLKDLGILKGELNSLIETQAYKPFYMHGSGHWLGLDVHDVGDYKIKSEWRALEEGMVFTVEPGLYITPSESVDEKWWNIGIRIEDDLMISQTGYQNLTADLPVQIDEIEALIGD